MKFEKLIYIAGPYSDYCGFKDIQKNIEYAEKAMERLLKFDWSVICPHKNTAHLDDMEDMTPWKWVDMDLVMLERCDAIYMLNGWTASIGAKREFEFACDNGIKIFYEENGNPKPEEVERKWKNE